MRRGWSIAAFGFASVAALAIAILAWREGELRPLVLGGLVVCAAIVPVAAPVRLAGAVSAACLIGAATLTAASVGVLLVPAAFCSIIALGPSAEPR